MCSLLFSGDGAWFYTNCKFLCLFLSGIYGGFFIYILLYNCLCHGPWACYWNKLNWNWNQYSRTTTCHTKIVLWWSPPEQHCETDEFQVWNKRLRKWWWWERKLVRNARQIIPYSLLLARVWRHSHVYVIVSRDTGVCLTIPEGAIRQGCNVEVYLAVLRDDRDRPRLSGRPAHYSLLLTVINRILSYVMCSRVCLTQTRFDKTTLCK